MRYREAPAFVAVFDARSEAEQAEVDRRSCRLIAQGRVIRQLADGPRRRPYTTVGALVEGRDGLLYMVVFGVLGARTYRVDDAAEVDRAWDIHGGYAFNL